MMDAELMTIFQNIQALIEQAKQMMGGTGAPESAGEPEEDMATKVLKLMKEMEGGKPAEAKEDEKKEDVAKSDEGPTASDDAKERVKETGDINDKNIKEVAKSIIEALAQKSVQKSNPVSEMAAVMKALAEENREIRKSLEIVLDGYGIADQIKKANAPATLAPVTKPVNNESDIMKTLDYIKANLAPKESVSEERGLNDFHKSLADNNGEMLRGIFVNNARNYNK